MRYMQSFSTEQVRDMEQKLKDAYMALGKAYYEGKFEDPLPQLLPLFDKITMLKKMGLEPVPQDGRRAAKFCPKCGSSIVGNKKFCTKCGYKLSI